jgi:hypothetical protein
MQISLLTVLDTSRKLRNFEIRICRNALNKGLTYKKIKTNTLHIISNSTGKCLPSSVHRIF